MKPTHVWVVVIGVLVVLGLGVVLMLGAVREATQPVSSLANEMGTQVARVFSQTPTVVPDPVTIVREVRELARLETIQYTLEKVITAESGQGPLGFLFGDRLLLIAHGSVIAGVDLSKVTPEDVRFDDLGRVYLRLPPGEIFVVTIDNERSYVYDRDVGLLTRGNVNLESAARKAAEDELEKAALEDGILEQARVNAENVLFRLLRSLRYSDVIFEDWGEEAP
jgi:archaellum component FlaG (FlaF/FlaG flagellin family)